MKRALLSLLLLGGCVARPELPQIDPGLAGLTATGLEPKLVLPGTRLDVLGRGFLDPTRGTAAVRLEGTLDGRALDVTLPAEWADATRLSAAADDRFLGALPARSGKLEASLTVISDGPLLEAPHVSAPIRVAFELAETLEPRLTAVEGGSLFVNDGVPLSGEGFLIGGGEGETHALVSGCFLPADKSGACAQAGVTIKDTDLVAIPSRSRWDRGRVEFPFGPSLAGIGPGTFTGTVRVENRLSGGRVIGGGTQPVAISVRKPRVSAIAPVRASLGQIVDVDGGGFVGAAADEVTLLHLTGNFIREGQFSGAPVDLKLVPRFESGRKARYVLDESDALGKTVDLRRVSGRFAGTVTPIVRKGAIEVVGESASVTLEIAPVKQVVYLKFSSSWRDSLKLFGLAAVEDAVRARVLEVAARDYRGLNVEFRTDEPADFALFAQVDLAGPDPNGLGLLGYDNTPGKDVGNRRLFDRIGGVNAQTQSDGYPGYGGVFVEQFLGFSTHPAPQVARLPGDSPRFDQVFDAVRSTPVTPVEAHAGVAALADGGLCPADPRDRPLQISCAVFVLGNLIGSTLTHEVGHSLGLANPTGESFHDPGDKPNRLMDGGDARPFEERAELDGQGPAVFCDDEFTYLRAIIGGSAAPPQVARPRCD